MISFGKKKEKDEKSTEPKKPKAPKAPKDPSDRISGGLASVFILIFIMAGGLAAQYTLAQNIIRESTQAVNRDKEQLAETESAILQLKFYEDNEGAIAKAHQSYAGGLAGPMRRDEFQPLPEYGFDNFLAIRIDVAKQAGFRLKSVATEFQRVAVGLSQLESRYPFLQVSKLSMGLPEGVLPLTEAPTFLDTEIQLFSPRL